MKWIFGGDSLYKTWRIIGQWYITPLDPIMDLRHISDSIRYSETKKPSSHLNIFAPSEWPLNQVRRKFIGSTSTRWWLERKSKKNPCDRLLALILFLAIRNNPKGIQWGSNDPPLYWRLAFSNHMGYSLYLTLFIYIFYNSK